MIRLLSSCLRLCLKHDYDALGLWHPPPPCHSNNQWKGISCLTSLRLHWAFRYSPTVLPFSLHPDRHTLTHAEGSATVLVIKDGQILNCTHKQRLVILLSESWGNSSVTQSDACGLRLHLLAVKWRAGVRSCQTNRQLCFLRSWIFLGLFAPDLFTFTSESVWNGAKAFRRFVCDVLPDCEGNGESANESFGEHKCTVVSIHWNTRLTPFVCLPGYPRAEIGLYSFCLMNVYFINIKLPAVWLPWLHVCCWFCNLHHRYGTFRWQPHLPSSVPKVKLILTTWQLLFFFVCVKVWELVVWNRTYWYLYKT